MRLEKFRCLDLKDRMPRSAARSTDQAPVTKLWERLLRDTRGITIIIVAFALPVLIGLAALGIETGLWYTIKRQDQAAADACRCLGRL
jgi:Flp pilus assembly protein TadG